MMFQDRHDAGRQLALKLGHYENDTDAMVLALPRGGVPVGYEVAKALQLPLDVFVVRKLGVPGYEELAMGAIGSGGVRVLNEEIVCEMRVSAEAIASATLAESRELKRREQTYRGNRPPLVVRGKTVILVDDGLATGSTMRAAVLSLRRLAPGAVIVAVPVGAMETCNALRTDADEVVCAFIPRELRAVGMWYVNFDQTTDEEVQYLLKDRRFVSGPRKETKT